jgi:hypothetical protein
VADEVVASGDPNAEDWVAEQAVKILEGKSAQVAAGIRRRATTFWLYRCRTGRCRRIRPLPDRQAALAGLRHRPGGRMAYRHRSHRRRMQMARLTGRATTPVRTVCSDCGC